MRETEYKVRRSPPSCGAHAIALSVEIELAKRNICCGATKCQLTKLDARHDVVLAVGPANLVEGIDCTVILKPVRTTVADLHTGGIGDQNIWNTRVSGGGVEIESRDVELRSGVLKTIDIPVVHEVSDQGIDTDVKVVDERRGNDVGIADCKIAAVGRSEVGTDRNRIPVGIRE